MPKAQSFASPLRPEGGEVKRHVAKGPSEVPTVAQGCGTDATRSRYSVEHGGRLAYPERAGPKRSNVGQACSVRCAYGSDQTVGSPIWFKMGKCENTLVETVTGCANTLSRMVLQIAHIGFFYLAVPIIRSTFSL